MATKTQKLTAAAAYSEVANSVEVERIDNSKAAIVPPMDPGDNTVQGDVYITRLDREIPGGKPATTRQLAPGTTQGSRHIAVGDCDVLAVPEDSAIEALNRLVPATRDRVLFVGPMIRARGPVTIEHPEHAWQTFQGPDMGEATISYLVTIQASGSDVLRRVED